LRNTYRIARIAGIDVQIHWTWLLAFGFVTWSLGAYYQDHFSWSAGEAYSVAGISAILLFATVLIHELAHALTARKFSVPVQTIYLFIFGGLSSLSQEPETPRAELFIALAGPLASLILAGICFLLHAATGDVPSALSVIFGYLASVNLLLALFNLIPGFPLDGGRVLRAGIWLATGNLQRATRIASSVGNVIGYLFIFGGLVVAFVLGAFVTGLWLVFIGWFLHNTATSTYQQTVVERVLAGVDVRNVMDQVHVFAEPYLPIDALLYRHLLNEHQRAVPVLAPDRELLGLVTAADVGKAPQDEWSILPVSRVMTPRDRLCTVAPGDSLRAALRIFAERQFHQLPVVTDGRFVGMLNRGHVLQYLHVRQQLQKMTDTDGRAGEDE
jgi:Zn-dependent protease/predicted transcriptional regulator